MPRPFPQREPTPDEQTPAQRVLAVFDALQRAKADAARLPEAEDALAEILAGEVVGEAVDPNARDQAKAEAARCQQARGLVAGLQRRLVAALEVYREAERDRLCQRKDAMGADVRHLESSLAALQAQAQEVAARYQQANGQYQAAIGEWADIAHRSYDQLLGRVLGRERPEAQVSATQRMIDTGRATATAAPAIPAPPPTPPGPFQAVGAGEAYPEAR